MLNILFFVGRAALQKRVMALLRRIEHPTAGNTEVNFLINLYTYLLVLGCFFFVDVVVGLVFLNTEKAVASSSLEVKS